MKFQQFFELPEGEHPGVAVTVVGTQSGQVVVSMPPNIDSLGVIALLNGGIQAMVAQLRRIEAETKSKIIKPPPGAIPIIKGGGNGRNGNA